MLIGIYGGYMQDNKDTFRLSIDRNIERWDEGLPLGNGEMGGLLFGNSKKLTLSLDRGDIWDRSGSPENTQGFSYENLVRLKKAGNERAIRKIFDRPYYRPTPTKLPVGKILFDLGISGQGRFELNLKKAEACFTVNNIYFKTYIHATDGVGFVKTNAPKFSFEVSNPKFGKRKKISDKASTKYCKAVSNKIKSLRYPEAVKSQIDVAKILYKNFIQPLNDGSCFGLGVACKRGKETQLVYYTCYGKNINEVSKRIKEKIFDKLNSGYDNNFDTHKDWWKDYFEQSQLILPDKFLENRYNICNYLLGAASRRGFYPMPLQGLWTACDDKHLPPWKGDYHHDLNTQMTYTSYLKANHIDQGLCFIDYLVSLTDRAREFAQKCYNAEGICLPSVMDIDGYALGGWAMYSLSPTNQLWLCQLIERHYSYTGDEKFFEKVAYPYIMQSAEFICSLLEKDEKGYYVLPISSSPEIHDNTLKSFLTPNSNYDQALIMYILRTAIRFCKMKEESHAKWQSYLINLRPLAVDNNGVLKLDNNELLNESHRHMSHAMAIHPLRLLDFDNEDDRRIINATVNYTENLGHKNHVGYSFAWLAEFEAIRHNGNKLYEYLTVFWKYFCSVNGFHLNGDYMKKGYSDLRYRPFTLEGNFCANDALQEAMVYSEKGRIKLFPAIPSDWRDVQFKNFLCWGGIKVSATMSNKKIVRAELVATKDVEFELVLDVSKFNIQSRRAFLSNKASAKIKMLAGEKIVLVQH